MFLGTALSAASVITEENAFREQVAAMPEGQREAAIKARNDWAIERRRQSEHAEMVQAAKPHNLWSFLGLGSK